MEFPFLETGRPQGEQPGKGRGGDVTLGDDYGERSLGVGQGEDSSHAASPGCRELAGASLLPEPSQTALCPEPRVIGDALPLGFCADLRDAVERRTCHEHPQVTDRRGGKGGCRSSS